MPTYGITPTGFYAKPLSVIDDEVDAGLRGILGDSAGTDVSGKIPLRSFAGQLKSLIVDMDASRWDLLQAIQSNLDPAGAVGVFQDAICAITGTTRNRARNSIATGVCIGTPLTSLSQGRVATVAGTISRFDTATGVQLATGTAYTPSGSYAPGNIRYIAGQNRTYACVATGIGDASGPSGTSLIITSGGSTWQYLGEGVGVAQVPFVAEVVGAIGVATGSLNTIVTPVSGWNAVYNLLPGLAGAQQEADSALRVRRDQELAAPGNTTFDAIRANVLKVNEGSSDPNHQPPIACTVFNNDTDITDANGVPPHSIEVLVQGGTTNDIAQAIWNSVGAGTRTYGSTTTVVTDSQGNSQLVNWTRPTEVQIWVTISGRYDATKWPTASDAVVAQTMLSALLTYTASWPIARDVRTSPLLAALMRGPAGTTGGVAVVPADPSASPVPGLLEVDGLFVGTATGMSSTAQIPITPRQIAVFDSTRVDVTAGTEDP